MDAGSPSLEGQPALVTGGGGFGRALAICLAAHGADVSIVDAIVHDDPPAPTRRRIPLRPFSAV